MIYFACDNVVSALPALHTLPSFDLNVSRCVHKEHPKSTIQGMILVVMCNALMLVESRLYGAEIPIYHLLFFS